MVGLQNKYNLKPCRIVLQRIKEESTEEIGVPTVKNEVTEDRCEEQRHVENDLQEQCRINFPKIKEEIVEEFKWNVNHPEMAASSSNSTSSTDDEISPAVFMKMEIVEEDLLGDDEIPIYEHYNFNEDYEGNACTRDPLATECMNSVECGGDSLQTAINSRETSVLRKEMQLEDEGTKKFLFFCSHCPIWSSDEKQMKLHYLSHETQSSRAQSSLPAAVKQPSYSIVGSCDQINRNIYSCSVCKAKFSEKGSMEAHICNHINEELFSDTHVSVKFAHKERKKIDIRSVMYSCSLCPAMFSQKSNLDAHSMIHKKRSLPSPEIDIRSVMFSCSVCPAMFSQKSNLDAHSLIHKEKLCLSPESQGKLLLKRKVINTSNKVVSCTLCMDKLPHKRKAGRPPKNAPQICPGVPSQKPCKDAVLRFPAELPQKRKIVKPKKKFHRNLYSCSLCSAKFSLEKYLSKHMLEHSNEENKLLSCSVCPAKFSQRTHLARHVLSHSGEKPFACSICPAKFSLKSYLTKHILSHSGEKPFQCPKCPAKFSLKWYLKKHMIIHTVVSQKLNLKARILNQMI